MKYYYVYENTEWEVNGLIEAPDDIPYSKIKKAFDKAQEAICLWLAEEEVPPEFNDCTCDKEFIERQLELSFGGAVLWIVPEKEFFDF